MAQVDSEVYARQLLPKNLGFPLYFPEPFDDLEESYKERGVSIGDVGIITENGAFDYIFSVCRPTDDPANGLGVPPGFEPVILGRGDISSQPEWQSPGDFIATQSVKRRALSLDISTEGNPFIPAGIAAGLQFTSSSKEGAILALPSGASQYNLRRRQKLKDYALKHGPNWYKFVNGTLERGVGNGALYLVTGCDKTSSWGVASFSGASEEGEISLKFKAAQVGVGHVSYEWQCETQSSVAVRTGPKRVGGEHNRPQNQCVFVRGFKVAVRENPLAAALRGSVNLSSVQNLKLADIFSKGSSVPFEGGSKSSIFGKRSDIGRGRSGSSQDNIDAEFTVDTLEDEVILKGIPETSEPFHPLTVVNKYLLESIPEVSVAVTHDDDWCGITEENESVFPDDTELLRRICGRYKIATEDGGVYLVPQDTFQADEGSPGCQPTLPRQTIPANGPNGSPSRGSMLPRKFAETANTRSAGIKENPTKMIDELWSGERKYLEQLKGKGAPYDRLFSILQQVTNLETREKELWELYKLSGPLDAVKLRQHCEESLRSERSSDSQGCGEQNRDLQNLDKLHYLRKEMIDILTDLTEQFGPNLGVTTKGRGFSQGDKVSNQKIPQRPNIWAILIGINEYKRISPLRGAVRDVAMVKQYLELDLSVPPSHIKCLTDAAATRTDILSTLYDHLRDNPEIQRGDAIIIHYSGRGATYDIHEVYKNSVGSIEAICPVDRGVEGADQEPILDISDREINLFLTELSSTKGDNITLVLDCCFAGVARADSESALQARDAPPLTSSLGKMLHTAEENTRKRWAGGSALTEDWKPDLSSHVILAACQDFERAWECDGKGGDFTVALLGALRSLPLHKSTYGDFIAKIGRLRRQEPYAVGTRVGHPIFGHGSDGQEGQFIDARREAEKRHKPVEGQSIGIMGYLYHALGYR